MSKYNIIQKKSYPPCTTDKMVITSPEEILAIRPPSIDDSTPLTAIIISLSFNFFFN